MSSLGVHPDEPQTLLLAQQALGREGCERPSVSVREASNAQKMYSATNPRMAKIERRAFLQEDVHDAVLSPRPFFP